MKHAALLCCLMIMVSTRGMAVERLLYALDEAPSEMSRSNADAKIVSTDLGKALEVAFHKSDWPNVYFSPSSGTWDWSGVSGFAVDIYNPEPDPVRVNVRIDNAGADGANFCANGSAYALSKVWTTLKLYFNTGKPVLWGMRGLPETGPIHQGKAIDLTKITAFQVFLGQPDKGHTLILSRARLFGNGDGLGSDVKLPFVDRFGQYKHADWPGKLSDEADFAVRIRSENADINAHPAPADWDPYGGWAKGPKLTATGWFRTQKVDGKWWLVTPEGHLFFSTGMDCVESSQGTFVTGRDRWFDWLPAVGDTRFQTCRGHADWSHSMAEAIGGKGDTFSFYKANLIRKYGDDWQTKWRDSAYARLKSWGFNTIANWSQADVLDNSTMPFTACEHIDSSFRLIEGGSGYWGKMMDVYDPRFPEAVDNAVGRTARRYASNHNLLGYFVDNELSWAKIGEAALASPIEQPCRVALMKHLQDKYSTVQALNKAWATDAKGWDDLRAPAKQNAACRNDLGAFSYAFAHRYFSAVKAGIRKYDKHHLYLGCRFAGDAPEAVARACGDVADVVSYNIYRESIDPNRWNGRTYTGAPVIIGEFHFGATDRGMFHPGLVDAGTQQGRADDYAKYVRSAVDCPSVVGVGWFKYADEPNTGRNLDGENYNIGFVDVTDTPYPELVNAAREVNTDVYARRGE